MRISIEIEISDGAISKEERDLVRDILGVKPEISRLLESMEATKRVLKEMSA